MANSNQFAQSTVRGRVSTQNSENIYNARIDSAVTTDVLAGDALKLVDTASEQTVLTPVTALTDVIYGFRVYDIIKDTRTGNDEIKVACDNVEMDMIASGAIAVGATVEYDFATGKVATVNTGYGCGIAMKKATADGDIIRVLIKTPRTA